MSPVAASKATVTATGLLPAATGAGGVTAGSHGGKALAPTIDKVAAEYNGKLAVFKVDIDNAPESASSFGIQSVPTCIFFKGGKEVGRFLGNQPLPAIKGQVDRVLA